MEEFMQRPGRPLGVSLAILASVFLFSLFPLILVAMVLIVQGHIQSADFSVGSFEPIAVGGDFLGVSTSNLAVQTILSLAFLVIAFFAWRGRPASIRFVMLGAVVVMTLTTLLATISQSTADQRLSEGVSSLDGMVVSVLCGQLGMSILVSLYVAWYLNRGPARAFYRGYYLPEHDQSVREPDAPVVAK
jgi:hypothetical protein